MEDNKRTFLAVGLCFVILIGWSFLSDKMGWTPPPPAPEKKVEAPVVEQPVAPAEVVPVPRFTPSEGREFRVETPLYTAVMYSGGGVLRSFSLKNFKETTEENSPLVNMISPKTAATAPMGMVVNGMPSWSVGSWSYDGGDVSVGEGETKSITLVGEVNGIRVSRVLTFDANTYLIKETMLLRTVDNTVKTARLNMTVASTAFGSASSYDPMRIGWYETSYDSEASESDLQKEGLLKKGTFRWAGVMSNYFMSAVAPSDSAPTLKGRVEDGVWRAGLERPDILLSGGNEVPISLSWWFGPKDRALLEQAPNDLVESIDYGMFSFIAKPLLSVLEFFQSYVGNWGIAILLLTLCIKILFWPLMQKSYKSMEQMKQVQPLMAQIREKYKDDREALNREVMQLYKTYGVNPMSGCLPMLVQIPVFIGLYQALLNAIQLRHASFISTLPGTDMVWLADLSAKDPYYITPLVMGATMFIQQKMAPPAGDPKQQKIMMLMPLVFLFMFLNFPSGLVIYWLCNNVLSIGQQWWLLRKIKSPAQKKAGKTA